MPFFRRAKPSLRRVCVATHRSRNAAIDQLLRAAARVKAIIIRPVREHFGGDVSRRGRRSCCVCTLIGVRMVPSVAILLLLLLLLLTRGGWGGGRRGVRGRGGSGTGGENGGSWQKSAAAHSCRCRGRRRTELKAGRWRPQRPPVRLILVDVTRKIPRDTLDTSTGLLLGARPKGRRGGRGRDCQRW